jgi:hypothetical protein
MTKVTFLICDVCGRKIDSDEEYKTMTILPRGATVRNAGGRARTPQRTVQVCENCFKEIGFQAEPSITLTRDGKIGRVDK